VNTTVTAPVAPHSSLRLPGKSFDHSTPPQISVAPAPACEFNQSCNSRPFPPPSHCTVRLDAGIPILGAVVSSIVKVATVVDVFPQSSVA